MRMRYENLYTILEIPDGVDLNSSDKRMIQKLNRRTSEVIILKHFHNVFALAQEWRGDVERVERTILVVAAKDNTVDAAETAVSCGDVQKGVRWSIRNFKFCPEKTHVIPYGKFRKWAVGEF